MFIGQYKTPHIVPSSLDLFKNTEEAVVIDDLDTDLTVIDEYLIQHRPKSLLVPTHPQPRETDWPAVSQQSNY